MELFKVFLNVLHYSLFSLRDISVHLLECSPFWVGIFIFLLRKLPCLLLNNNNKDFI